MTSTEPWRDWSKHLKTACAALALGGALWAGVPAARAADVVNVYNWGNSIGKATIANFEGDRHQGRLGVRFERDAAGEAAVGHVGV